MRARVRDCEIYFDIEGTGLIADGMRMREKPAAFLVHGGPGADHTGLRAAHAPLAEHVQLVYFDHRGHGRSASTDPATYVLDENVEDMEALRRHLGLGPIISIGTSYGGIVAMAHAARYPSAVSRLVLVATSPRAGNLARAKEILGERGSALQVAFFESLLAGEVNSNEKFRDFMAVMSPLYSRKHDGALTSEGLKHATLSPEPLNRAYAPGGALRHYDLRPELTRITAATLILAGRHDWICPPEFSQEMHVLIPGAQLRIFDESGHSIRADEPQAYLESIIGFLQTTGQST
jgi:proline iminopeptidase